ncbi:thiopeptide-type bacteriocin biosynthesis protein [Acrocarpospora sp. B8E8]|uniref:thiopeptide-type bacteriocin biosynthesis protein n=1 Tax=Acrocarpospora sp. B8E8 TaxID=3153572 RepID=UPI00325FA9A1
MTLARPDQLATGVLTVLGGTSLEVVAAGNGLDPCDLAEALQVYHAAGLAALERRAGHEWYQVRVQFPDWGTAETAAATQLGTRLDLLLDGGAVSGWWFLRKHPCWRLRLRDADITAVDQMLDELTTAGILAGWRPTIYEPEIAAFGGPAAMQTAHDLFCADSRSVLNYVRQDAPGLGRRELSLLLINGLMGAAGLDAFERGDVFARVARLRPALDAAHVARAEELAGKVRILLAVPLQPSSTPSSALFAPGGPVAFATPWLAAFQSAGHWFGEAAAVGRLERGVRAILTHVAIFHWNRIGLSAATQAVLARAARAALLPET